MPTRKKSDRACRRDALVLIDVINDFDFPGARTMLTAAVSAARKLARLKERARAAGVPVIYVNDNFGRWRSDFRQQVVHCREQTETGRRMVELLSPEEDDFFVLKPLHSGFYSTTLSVLLEQLGVRRLILGGFAADICVLYTANDAYMRGYELVVPRDCLAAETRQRYRFALQHIEAQLKADVAESTAVRFRRVRA